MSHIVQQFFVHQALHLKHGRIEDLSRSFSVPLLVMLPQNQGVAKVLNSRFAVETFFTAKFKGLQSAGIDYLRARVTGIEELRNESLTARVIWFYLDNRGARQGETRARYFIARHGGGLRVEMITFDHLAFSAIADWIEMSVQTRAAPVSQLH